VTRLMTTLLAIVVFGAAACSRQVTPAALDPVHTQCQYCRMTASDVHFAAQIAAAGAEPIFFDDIGCLRDYLKQNGPLTPLKDEQVAFVADHRTGAWVRATDAVFTRPRNLATPMGGGIIAHADQRSRDADPAAAGGAPLGSDAVLGSAGSSKGAGK
jgi:copper chaperone NosL